MSAADPPPTFRPGDPVWRAGWETGRDNCRAIAAAINDGSPDPLVWSVTSMLLARIEAARPAPPTLGERPE